jgi:hypothetical protein
VRVRYKVWRSNKDKEVHVLCAQGADAFEASPSVMRITVQRVGRAGEVDRPWLPYRSMLVQRASPEPLVDGLNARLFGDLVLARVSRRPQPSPC